MHHITGKDRNEICLQLKFENLIDEENAVRVIDLFIDEINLYELGFEHAVCSSKGRPPYNPKDMMKLYIYGYLNGIRSSRKLEKEVNRNIELIWLLKDLHPDYKTISEFRKNNAEAIVKLFKVFTVKCKEMSLYGGKVIAVDGTKFKANNSKKNNFSLKKIENKLKNIDKKLENYFKELDENDEQESNEPQINPKRVAEVLKQIEEEKKKNQNLKAIRNS